MKPHLYQLTELDVVRLEKHAERDSRLQATLDDLLERAEIVSPDRIRPDVITMNSRFTLSDPATGDTVSWTLAYPDHAQFDEGRLNVFSPVGLALLGARQGQALAVNLPGGTTRTMIVSTIVFQPEANGEYTR